MSFFIFLKVKNKNFDAKLVFTTTKAKLILHIFFIILPILLLSLFFDWRLRQHINYRASENFLSVVQILSKQHEQSIHDAQQLLHILSHTPSIIEQDVQKCDSFLSELKIEEDIYAGISLLDINGQLICGTGHDPKKIVSIGLFRQYFTSALRSKGPTRSEYTIGVEQFLVSQ